MSVLPVHAALGVGRVAAGSLFLARPAAFARLLGVDSVTSGRLAWQSQMIGAREIGLGLGLLAALRRNPAPWLLAGALADGVDSYAFTARARAGDVRPGVGYGLGAVAAGAAAFGAATSRSHTSRARADTAAAS
ncbi:MAG TPA: hypothetical protein VEZ46_12910 [Mycobacteriales bacterium]|jgi:hypothetical protein|nr:hypothetical protein [Mycobacteriales bacterium]